MPKQTIAQLTDVIEQAIHSAYDERGPGGEDVDRKVVEGTLRNVQNRFVMHWKSGYYRIKSGPAPRMLEEEKEKEKAFKKRKSKE